MKSLSHVRLLVTHGLQPTRLLHPWDFPGKSTRVVCHCLLRPTPRAYVNSCPSSQWCIQLSHPLSFPSPLAFNLSRHQGLFQWVSSSHQVAKVLELQHQSFQWIFRNDFLCDWLVGFPCSPRDSQEFSPTPQFKSINSLAPSFIYGPTLTYIHDYWKNHSFD